MTEKHLQELHEPSPMRQMESDSMSERKPLTREQVVASIEKHRKVLEKLAK